MSSVLVSGAGTASVNGTYTVWASSPLNGKTAYVLSGTEPGDPGSDGIYWDGTQWRIYGDGGTFYYFSDDDVAEPWLVTTWQLDNGSEPFPTVTEVASGQPTQRRWNGIPGMGKGQSFGRSW